MLSRRDAALTETAPLTDAADRPLRIALIAAPGFNLAATTAFVDPFRAANYLEGRPLFRWTMFSATGGAVRASNGLSVATTPLEAAETPARGAQLVMRPKTLVSLDLGDAKKVLHLVEALEDLDDVQDVFHNLDITDELIESLDD